MSEVEQAHDKFGNMQKENVNDQQRHQLFQFGKIIDDSLNEIYIIDAGTLKFKYVNYGARVNLGYSLEELYLLTPLDLKDDYNREAYERLLNPLVTAEKSKIQFETTHRRKNGSYYHVKVQMQPTEYANAPAFVAITMDITTQIKQEAQIREIQERYDALFNRSIDGVFICDFEGNFIDANDVTLSWTGYKREDIPHVKISDLLSQGQLLLAAKDIEEVITLGKQKHPRIYQLKTKYNQTIWVETLGSLIYNNGSPVGIQGVVRNVTPRVLTELSLKKHNRLLKEQNDLLFQYSTHQKLINLSLEEKFKRITESIAKILDVARVSIWEIDSKNTKIICRSLYDKNKELHQHGTELMACDYPNYFGALGKGIRIIAHDAIADRRTSGFTENYLLPHGITSMLDTPIHVEGILYGVLCLEHVGKARKWSIEEENFAATITDLVTLFIVNERNKESRQRLIESERQLETAIQSTGMALWDADFKTQKVRRSENWFTMLGYQKDEIHNNIEAWESLVHTDDLNKLNDNRKSHESGLSDSYEGEHRLKTKQGDYKWILNWGRIIERDKKGRPSRAFGVHIDIDKQKKTLLALEKSELMISKILDSTDELFAFYDKDFNIILYNKAVCETLGVSATEFIGKKCFYLWRPGQKHFCEGCHFQKAFKENVRNEKDANIGGRIFRFRVVLVKDARENILGLAEFGRDVTDIIQAETMIRQATRIIEDSPVVVFRWKNTNGWPVEYVSENIKGLTGYSSSELTSGRVDYMKMVYYKDRKRLSKEVVNYSIEENLNEYTHWPYRLVTKDKNIIWVQDTTKVIKDKQGNITHFEGIIQDVTKRVLAEEQVKQTMERFRAVFEGLKLGMIILNKKGIVQSINSTVTKITGIKAEQVVGKHILKLSKMFLDASILPQVTRFTTSLLSNKKPRSIGIKFKGRALQFHTVINLQDYGIVVAFEDVTEQAKAETKVKEYSTNLENLVQTRTREIEKKNKSLEESQIALTYLLEDVNDTRLQLQQANLKMQEANEELESFSYSVSHDLKAPLRAIDGFSQILLEDYSKKLDYDGIRYLNVVRENTQNMGQLIQDLLDFSRAGRTKLIPEEINIREMVTQILDEVLILEKPRKIKIDVGELPLVHTDRALLRQVFFNLLSNAVKFTRAKAQAIIDIGYKDRDNLLEFYVKDNGVGFDMTYKEKLFVVFQRLHTVDQYEGTGVGLALVNRIIKRLGGSITADGKPGQGAIFRFTIPKTCNKKD